MAGYNAYYPTYSIPVNTVSTSAPTSIPSGYYNYSYNPTYTAPQVMQQPQQTQAMQQGGINWVQGEAGAKSFNVLAGQTVMLMDSEENVFYIKSTDASGMPLPLRIFDYKERTATNNSINSVVPQVSEPDMSNYITREEFENRINSLNIKNNNPNRNERKKVMRENESSVQSFK